MGVSRDRKKMRYILLSFISLLIFQLSTLKAEEINRIIAVVNEEVITQQDLDYYLLPLYKQYENIYTHQDLRRKIEEARKEMLEQIIEDKLILQEAKKEGIKVEEEEIERELERVKEKFSSSEEFFKALEEEHLSIQELKERFKEQIMLKKAVKKHLLEKVRITPQEVFHYYQSHKKEFTHPERVKVRMLSFTSKEKGIEAWKELRKGEKFTIVAHRYAQKEEVRFIARGEMVPEIENIIFNLRIGEFSGLVKTELGYHIFKVEGRKQKRLLPLEEVRERIERTLWERKSEEEMKKWTKELKEEAYIEILRE